MSTTYITTITGKHFDFMNPDPSMVDIADIAYALAYTNRWGGHAAPAISVGQHSILVSDRLLKLKAPPMIQMQGLLHDAAEAYLGDIPTPIKAKLPEYRAMEILVEAAIFDAFQVNYPLDKQVHLVDVEVRNWEYRDRMKMGTALPLPVGNPPIIPVMHPDDVFEDFLVRYYDLAEALNILQAA